MAHHQLDSGRKRRKPPSAIRLDGDIAYVTLNKGLEAIIDASDVDLVSGRAWAVNINVRYGNKYAYCYDFEAKRSVSMHRHILKPSSDLQVDHVDGNGLNNRRANLRAATPAENQSNKRALRRNKLGMKGVSRDGNRYVASINPGNKKLNLGSYNTKEEAAAAYFGAAVVLWGEFARK